MEILSRGVDGSSGCSIFKVPEDGVLLSNVVISKSETFEVNSREI
jgi:hypothetical protein